MRKIQSLQSMKVSHMLNFRFFYGFYKREGKSDRVLIESDRDVNVLMTVFSHSHLGREKCR